MKRLTAARLARVIARYLARKGNECGGSLHVQLDDWNQENKFFDEESERWCIERKDWSGLRLLRLMRKATRTQRLKATGLAKSDPYEMRPQWDVSSKRRKRIVKEPKPSRQPILTTDSDGKLFWL